MTCLTTRYILFQSILENPADDTLRLIYADCLDELVDSESECAMCKGTGKLPIYPHFWTAPKKNKDLTCGTCAGSGRVIYCTNTAHAAMIRDGVENGGYAQSVGRVGEAATARDGSVFLASAIPGVAFTVRRGFVDEISLSLGRFTELFNTCDGTPPTRQEFKAEMRYRYPWPLTRVRLTDRIPEAWPNFFLWHQVPEAQNRAGLPLWLWQRLPASTFHTSQLALNALSRAAVSWFREVCGLSEIKS
jgi:uncharacterized protein (TIGR02996 family)